MRVLLDLSVLFALLLLGYLFYLVLFERGALYRTNTEVHGLGDRQRLRLLGALLGTPPLHIESFRILREGPELYDVQLEAIAGARKSIHLEAYIFYPGRIADRYLAALCERASSGVRVRVVIDAIGSLRLRKSFFEPLIAAGGQVTRYHPLHLHMLRRWNSRTHRNLLVVDGEVAFIGGAGVADHWCRSHPPPWRDCAIRVTGPIIAGMQAVFAENWLESAGELLVGEDTFPDQIQDASRVEVVTPGLAVGSTPTAGRSTRARVLVQFLLATARESIDICSPYFVPDLGIRLELIAARERGVRVRILTGGPYSDHGLVRRAGRRRYGVLLNAGIEIAEYNSRMMHAKVLLVDGRWSLLGSTNIDNRSFGLNDEVNLLVFSEALASQLRAAYEDDLNQSTTIDLQTWLKRPWSERILATLGRVLERHQ